jgi:Flp pilus assembly protein TadD
MLPTPERPAKPPIWVSLGLSDTKVQIVGGIIAAVVAGLLVLIYVTEPPEIDETARPAAAAVTSRPQKPAVDPPSSPTAAPSGEGTAAVGIFEPSVAAVAASAAPADIAGLEAKRKAYEAQLAASPDEPTLLNDLGLVLDQMGRAGDAIPRFERAIALSPQQPNFHFNLGRAAANAGLWDRAVAEYREAARGRPQDFFSQYAIALTLHRKGDDEAAIPEFQKASALSPNDPNVHLLLGVCLERAGRPADAVAEYRRYLKIQPNSDDAERLRAHLQALGVDKS